MTDAEFTAEFDRLLVIMPNIGEAETENAKRALGLRRELQRKYGAAPLHTFTKMVDYVIDSHGDRRGYRQVPLPREFDEAWYAVKEKPVAKPAKPEPFSEEWALSEIATMSKQAAQYCIETVERTRVKMPDKVMEALTLQSANGHDAERFTPVRELVTEHGRMVLERSEVTGGSGKAERVDVAASPPADPPFGMGDEVLTEDPPVADIPF